LLALTVAVCFALPIEQWESIENQRAIKGVKLEEGYICGTEGFYLAGDQNGKFTPRGWHISNEMGGIWQQPIKLFDGYTFAVATATSKVWFDQALEFSQYPWGNRFVYEGTSKIDKVERVEFVSKSKFLQVEFLVSSSEEHDSFQLELCAQVDLRPSWLADWKGIEDGFDECWFNEEVFAIVCKDTKNDWYSAIGGNNMLVYTHPDFNADEPENHVEICFTAEMENLGSGKFSASVFLVGSTQSEEEIVDKLSFASQHSVDNFLGQVAFYSHIQHNSELQLPDLELQDMLEWLKYNIQWVTFDIPEIGRGVAGGLPEYPMFFGCDTTYTVQGLLSIGEHYLAQQSLDLLEFVSLFQNQYSGRIIHELSTSGAVYNSGNVQETAHYVMQIWNLFLHTGNWEWLSGKYHTVRRNIEYLRSADSDGNLIPEGPGIMEISSLHQVEMIDVAAYTQGAFQSAANIARALSSHAQDQCGEFYESCPGWSDDSYRVDCFINNEEECIEHQCCWDSDTPPGYPWCFVPSGELCALDTQSLDDNFQQWSSWAEELKDYINSVGWVNSENSYADFLATPTDALEIIRDAIKRIEGLGDREDTLNWLRNLESSTEQQILHGDDQKQGWVVFHNWITFIPLEMNLADQHRANLALSTAEKFLNDYGVFVSGIDKSSNSEGNTERVDLYTNAVMTIPTNVLATAEARNGRIEESLRLLKTLANSFSFATPGSLHEISPQGGCFVQAWNVFSMVPVVNSFFGISPRAHERTIDISPHFPTQWNWVKLHNYQIGSNFLSLDCNFNSLGEVMCEIISDEEHWTVNVFFEFPFHSSTYNFFNNGRAVAVVEDHRVKFTFATDQHHTIVRVQQDRSGGSHSEL